MSSSLSVFSIPYSYLTLLLLLPLVLIPLLYRLLLPTTKITKITKSHLLAPEQHRRRLKNKAAFIRSNHDYGYLTSSKGFIDSWRSVEFPGLAPPLVATPPPPPSPPSLPPTSLPPQHYLDAAGAAQPTASQLQKILAHSQTTILANPHSVGPAANHTSQLITRATHTVLSHFAPSSPHSYSLLFTANATASLSTLSNIFPFTEGSSLIYATNSHTSVLGTRVNARKTCPTTAVHAITIEALTDPSNYPIVTNASLLIIPAECNFTGALSPLPAILSAAKAASPHFKICLDLSKHSASHNIDVHSLAVDFAVGSFYKIFGYPTGLGHLLVKRTAMDWLLLEDRATQYFGGGDVDAVLPGMQGEEGGEPFFSPRRKGLRSLNAGTVNFRAILSLQAGFDELDQLGGLEAIGKHTRTLAKHFISRLTSLTHANGLALATVHSPANTTSIVTFTLSNGDGSAIGYNEVVRLAELEPVPIQIRGGCFCNIGACQKALGLSDDDVVKNLAAGHTCGDQLDVVEGRGTGAVRVSFGKESCWEDCEAMVDFLERQYVGAGGGGEVDEGERGSEVECGKIAEVTLDQLYLFPIKSCCGTNVSKWPVDGVTGKLKFDREFALIDAGGTAMRLNIYPAMALIKSEVNLENLTMTVSAPGKPDLVIDLRQTDCEETTVTVCSAKCAATVFDDHALYSEWFSSYLKVKCFLARNGESNDKDSFANEAPLLLLTRQSVERLNGTLRMQGKAGVSARHFRPNLVLNVVGGGGGDNPEDSWTDIDIGGVLFEVTGKCQRCAMVDFDPTSGANNGSTLRALSTFRREKSRIIFGVFVRRKPQTRCEQGEEGGVGGGFLAEGSKVQLITADDEK